MAFLKAHCSLNFAYTTTEALSMSTHEGALGKWFEQYLL